MLEVRDLEAWYGTAKILHGVTLSLAPGKVLALLGRNGVGKTTTVRSVSGLVRRVRGEVECEGGRLLSLPGHKVAQAGVSYVPEGRAIFPSLSVEENLKIALQDRSRWPEVSEKIYAIFPDLMDKRNLGGTTLSGGQQEMLAVARALAAEPKYLLLDEPTQGLSPLYAKRIMQVINEVATSGVGVLLVEQNLNLALTVAHDVMVMAKGEIRHRHTREDVVEGGVDLGALIME